MITATLGELPDVFASALRVSHKDTALYVRRLREGGFMTGGGEGKKVLALPKDAAGLLIALLAAKNAANAYKDLAVYGTLYDRGWDTGSPLDTALGRCTAIFHYLCSFNYQAWMMWNDGTRETSIAATRSRAHPGMTIIEGGHILSYARIPNTMEGITEQSRLDEEEDEIKFQAIVGMSPIVRVCVGLVGMTWGQAVHEVEKRHTETLAEDEVSYPPMTAEKEFGSTVPFSPMPAKKETSDE